MSRSRLNAILALTTLALTTTALQADTIRLRSTVTLSEPGVVRLGDIAALDGPHASKHADLVLIENASGAREITVGDVRRALDAAGAHWGFVNLSGRRVQIGAAAEGPGRPPQAMGEVSLAIDSMTNAASIERNAADIVDDRTLEGVIARLCSDHLNIAPADLHLEFVKGLDDIATDDPSVRFEVVPESSFYTNLVSLSVRVWRADRLVTTTTVALRPTLRTRVAVPTRELPRGTTIEESDFTVRELWLPPSRHRATASPAELIGQISKRRLVAEGPIRRAQVETPHVIDRGDRITVRCLVGGVVVSLQAEAREAGGIGTIIECRKLGERRSFRATVVGPGVAVFDLSKSETNRSTQQAQRQPRTRGASS